MTAPRKVPITRQKPNIVPPLQRNHNGSIRQFSELDKLLTENGVVLPHDVTIEDGTDNDLHAGTFEDLSDGHLTTARTQGLMEDPDGFVHFSDFYNRPLGAIPIFLNPVIFVSDEAILAVIVHELYELALFRELFDDCGGAIPYEHFVDLARPYNEGNFHSRAWDEADRFIHERRRRQ